MQVYQTDLMETLNASHSSVVDYVIPVGQAARLDIFNCNAWAAQLGRLTPFQFVIY